MGAAGPRLGASRIVPLSICPICGRDAAFCGCPRPKPLVFPPWWVRVIDRAIGRLGRLLRWLVWKFPWM
jgi:hypothetical protein